MTHAQTLDALRATGHRITPQRQLVLEVIESSPEHLDAEAIYQRVRKKDSHIGLATVYRTLTVLKDMGLIEQRYLARNHDREFYEPVGAPEHHHFTCLSCHTVVEFQSPRVKQMRADLQGELGLEIGRVCICIEGYCRSCSAKRRKTNQ